MKTYTTPTFEEILLPGEDILTVSTSENGDGMNIKFPTL